MTQIEEPPVCRVLKCGSKRTTMIWSTAPLRPYQCQIAVFKSALELAFLKQPFQIDKVVREVRQVRCREGCMFFSLLHAAVTRAREWWTVRPRTTKVGQFKPRN